MSDAPGRTELETPRQATGGRASPVETPIRPTPGQDGDLARVDRTVANTATRPRLNVRRIAMLASAAVGIVLLIALVWYWRANAGLVKTDNAQTAGDIAPVSSRIMGTIVKVDVTENKHLAPGDPLIELDPQDYQVALSRAQAALTAAQAQVQALRAALGAQQQQFEAGLAAARARVQATQPTLPQARTQVDMQDRTTAAQLTQANARVTTAAAAVAAAKSVVDTAARTLRRDRQLLAEGAIAQQQLDADASAYETARAQYQAAQDALAQAKADVLAAQAARQQVAIARGAVEVNQGELSGAQAQVAQAAAGATLVRQRAQELAAAEAQAADAAEAVHAARLNLDRTVIRAPVDGWVTNRTAQVGQVIQPNQPLLSLTLAQGVWVVANIKETQLGRIRPGQAVRVRIDAYRKRTYHGHVDSIGAATGSTSALLPPDNATGNFVKVVQLVPVRITLDPRDTAEAPLQVGLSAAVAIDIRGPAR